MVMLYETPNSKLSQPGTLVLEIDVHYMSIIISLQKSLRFNLRASIFKNFLGGMPQTPSISMLCMLIVLHQITHTINYPLYKIPQFNHVPLIREHNLFLDPIAC